MVTSVVRRGEGRRRATSPMAPAPMGRMERERMAMLPIYLVIKRWCRLNDIKAPGGP